MTAGPLLPVVRGAGRQIVPVRLLVKSPAEGYMSVRPSLWVKQEPGRLRRLMRVSPAREQCFALPVADTAQPRPRLDLSGARD